jgi:hypothetical protein
MKVHDRLTWLQWLLIGVILLMIVGVIGIGIGYLEGEKDLKESVAVSFAVELQKQFELGMKDLDEENYELAIQRFEYILQRDPEYPDALGMLSESILQAENQNMDQSIPLQETVVFITQVPTPSITPTPTPDTREIDELALAVQNELINRDWTNLVNTILSLRNIDPLYRVSEIDKALYLALYFGGIDKILNIGDLEGGLYDLTIANQFSPLDSTASIYQNWARLYLIGMSFWGVYPDQAVYYFGQLAQAAPYLKDLSGIPATNRYRMALIQYGDQLATAEEWCDAHDQYLLAQSLYNDPGLQPIVNDIYEKCQISIATYTPSPTISPTPTITSTPTITITLTPSLTFTPAPTGGITLTPSPTQTASPTSESSATPSSTPTFTGTPTASPTSGMTATPEPTSTSTNTPTPSDTSTLTATSEESAVDSSHGESQTSYSYQNYPSSSDQDSDRYY